MKTIIFKCTCGSNEYKINIKREARLLRECVPYKADRESKWNLIFYLKSKTNLVICT